MRRFRTAATRCVPRKQGIYFAPHLGQNLLVMSVLPQPGQIFLGLFGAAVGTEFALDVLAAAGWTIHASAVLGSSFGLSSTGRTMLLLLLHNYADLPAPSPY